MTTTHRITDIERTMFAKGYASTGIVARKTQMHRTTVARLFKSGDLVGKQIAKQNFVELESVREYMGDDAIELFGLDDWSDVVPAIVEPEDLNGAAPRKRAKRKRS